jgi:hypothetical protein
VSGCFGGGDNPPPESRARQVSYDSALLTGVAECAASSACSAHYRYRVTGSDRWVRTAAADDSSLGPDDEERLVRAQRVTALRPATRYEFQACSATAAGVRCGPPDGEDAESGRFRTRLRLQPPRLDDPKHVDLDTKADYCRDTSPTGGDGSLEAGQDYLIRLPSTPLPCPLDVRGGHDIVIKGGEIAIPDINESPRNPELHRGLYLTGQTGTVHIEGVRLRGSELSVPIVLNEANGATVQIQQVRADRIFTDYPNSQPLHADCVQTWAGPKVLRIDGYTCTTDYFGLQLSPTQYGDDANTWPQLMEFRHMNFRPWRPNDLTRFMFWRTRTDPRTTWWPMIFDEVWTEPGYEGTGTEGQFTCYSGQFVASIPDNQGVWQEKSHDQDCRSWPRFNFGQPPDGDFVKARDVGLDYESAGY